MLTPLEQFEVLPLKGLFYFFDFFGISVTNFTVSAIIGIIIILLVMILGVSNAKFLATPGQYFLEFIYGFIYGLFMSNLSEEEHKYFPYVFTLFILILSYNLLGLFPYGYTLTSQIVVAALFSFSTFIGLLWIGVARHGVDFIGIFFPPEAPSLLAFLLVPIEIVSFFSRPFSLAIRLFANMTAGHVLLKILAGFAIVLFSAITSLHIDFLAIITFLAGGFNQFADASYPVLDSYFLSLSFMTLSHVLYNSELSITGVIYYYSHIFYMEDLLENEAGEGSFWIMLQWRALFYANYLAPLMLGPSKVVRFTADFMAVMIPVIESRDVLLFSHSQFLFYVNEPWIFYHMLYASEMSLLSISNNCLCAFNITFVSNVVGFIVWLAVAILSVSLPITLLSFFIILELFVSILQAYVFTILTVIYLRDVIDLH